MTSRLKHKLELENVNLKSAYLNESFVQIGTPLPALAETKHDKQEYVPLWEQEVRDEKGRRRFHGAFTGGWSAGYFNSVGSKEGWAPAQFKSSRSNRASRAQRAEDFMDEEDLAQMNESRRLENTEAFQNDGFGGTKEELSGKSLSSTLESLVVPAKTSIGQSLLQKMGWRPGQGVGPRVTLRKLRIQEGKLGRIRTGLDIEDDANEGEASKHTYAPRDTKLLVYTAKDDKEGLGYQKGAGMGRLPARRAMYGAGLGDDDEDDPYGTSLANEPEYVFDNMEEDDEVIHMGAPQTSKPASAGQSGPQDENHWHDGRVVLSGFIINPKGIPTEKWFKFPEIPLDWRPRPARVWGTTRKFDDEPMPEVKPTVRGAPGRPLTHEQRGAALGEHSPQVPGVPEVAPESSHISAAASVLEWMTEKDRERLLAAAEAAKAGAVRPPPLSLEAEPELPPARMTEIVVPPLSPRTASSALMGFIPFGDDPHKQERYKSYLVSQTHNTKHPNPQLLPSTSVEEVNKELESFAASARIFRPMSHAMSSRFTSGSASLTASDMKQPRAGLHLFDPEKTPLQFAAASSEVEDVKVLTPREQAAANGQYGRLTREVKEFYPVKLVCKRFHVQDPHPEGKPDGSGTSTPNPTGMGLDALPLPKNDASWESKFAHQEGSDHQTAPPQPQHEEGEHVPRNLGEVGMADDVNQGRDILTYTKPSIDIFKAIFASDDEGSDADDEPAAAAEKAMVIVDETPKDPFPVDTRPVDYATFKPVFRRGGAGAGAGSGGGEKDTSTETATGGSSTADKKKKDKKKKRKGVLSFDTEEDRDTAFDKPKKKPKALSTLSRQEHVEEEWVEKAPAVSSSGASASASASGAPRTKSTSPPKTGAGPRFRKGASDFM